MLRQWAAPDGMVWVCGACGKNGKQVDRIGDVSCFINAVLCWGEPKQWSRANHWEAVSFPTEGMLSFVLVN